jgi:hypothetical protein
MANSTLTRGELQETHALSSNVPVEVMPAGTKLRKFPQQHVVIAEGETGLRFPKSGYDVAAQ